MYSYLPAADKFRTNIIPTRHTASAEVDNFENSVRTRVEFDLF